MFLNLPNTRNKLFFLSKAYLPRYDRKFDFFSVNFLKFIKFHIFGTAQEIVSEYSLQFNWYTKPVKLTHQINMLKIEKNKVIFVL